MTNDTLREKLEKLVERWRWNALNERTGWPEAPGLIYAADDLTAILAESEEPEEPNFRDITATRCLRHATIPPTILPPANEECGICMRDEGILTGRSEARPETAWLIESRFTPAPSWWTGTGWSRDSLEAVRFSRKRDAWAEMPQLPEFHTCFATEHQWGLGSEPKANPGQTHYVGDDCPGGHAEVGEPKPLPLGHPYLRANDFDECGACGQPRSAHEPKPASACEAHGTSGLTADAVRRDDAPEVSR